MTAPVSVMTAPDLSVNANGDLIRRIIEARTCYERLCGMPPTCIHVASPFVEALASQGFKVGAEVAGMRIVASPVSIADMAVCSRDDRLFMTAAIVPKSARGKAR